MDSQTLEKLEGCRSEVLDFAVEMERVLKENDHKGRQGWKFCPRDFLMEKLLEEVAECAVSTGRSPIEVIGIFTFKLEHAKVGRLGKEAVDAGNMAMMVWDRERGR